MKQRRLILAAAVLALLCAAFFWGGDYAVKTVSPVGLSGTESVTAVPGATMASSGGPSAMPSPKSEGQTGALVSATPRPADTSVSPPPSASETKLGESTTVSPSPSGQNSADEDATLACTLSVSCSTILDNLEIFNDEKLEVLPADGVIFPAQTITFYEGETVFNVLQREMKKNNIHMEFAKVPLYNSNYIEGIGNIYEFDCGELSGWVYKVNGVFPGYSCSQYALQTGDVIEWVYTCDQGRDVGGSNGAWEETT